MCHGSSGSIETCLSVRTARTMRRVLVGLLAAVLLVVQSAEARPQVTMRPRDFPIGVPIQVQMIDGRVLQGKLASRSGASFELLESGSGNATKIEYTDINKVTKIAAPPRKKRESIGTAIMVGVFLAATGIAAAIAGKIY